MFASLLGGAGGLGVVPAEAKTPGKTYCFRGYCHKVLTLDETQKLVGTATVHVASNYDDCKHDRFNPCGLTSSGSVFHPEQPDNAASPIYPDGTVVLVRHPKNKRSAVLRINSAGPYHKNRTLDVSRATAEVLNFDKQGVADLEVKVLKAPTKQEASYRERRIYPPVPGFLGVAETLEMATAAFVELDRALSQVAAFYPQTEAVDNPRQTASLTGKRALRLAGNGIERTWLSKPATTKRLAKAALQPVKKTDRHSRLQKAHHIGHKVTA